MYKQLMLAVFAGAAVVAAASCSSGGGNVTGNNPLNPTTAPSGVVVSASPVAGGTTTAPTATPTAVSTTATSTPSPTPTPTPTTTNSGVTPSPTPSPTSSSTSTLATTCATATGSPSSMNYTLTGSQETIQLPNYPASPPYQIMGSSVVPSQSPSGSVLTLQLSQNSFGSGFQTKSGYPTVDFYTTLEINQSTTFGNGSTSLLIPVTIVSPCVVSGRTYAVDEASGGLSVYTETDTPTMNGSVTGHIQASLNPFPGNTLVYITVSH